MPANLDVEVVSFAAARRTVTSQMLGRAESSTSVGRLPAVVTCPTPPPTVLYSCGRMRHVWPQVGQPCGNANASVVHLTALRDEHKAYARGTRSAVCRLTVSWQPLPPLISPMQCRTSSDSQRQIDERPLTISSVSWCCGPMVPQQVKAPHVTLRAPR